MWFREEPNESVTPLMATIPFQSRHFCSATVANDLHSYTRLLAATLHYHHTSKALHEANLGRACVSDYTLLACELTHQFAFESAGLWAALAADPF